MSGGDCCLGGIYFIVEASPDSDGEHGRGKTNEEESEPTFGGIFVSFSTHLTGVSLVIL